MKHEGLRWNPAIQVWFCTRCGRTSSEASVFDAQGELDRQECRVPSIDASSTAPGTETTRLIKKTYKMALNVERSGIRFAVKTVEGKPFVQLDLFHDTVPSLNELSVGFELLRGVTLEQARTLVDAMNERIVGIVVAPK